MNIDNLIIPPKTLSLLTTYQCSAACKNCCFQCNPNNKQALTVAEMKSYIDQSVEAYPQSMVVLVLTGGECFLLGSKLGQIIEYATNKGLSVRVVTNGYWAKTYEIAKKKLQKLVDLGLKEINFSTGDDHQEYVPYENIVCGSMASIDLGLVCVVNIETHDNSKFSAKDFYKEPRLKNYLRTSKGANSLIIEQGVWIPFDKESKITYDKVPINKKESQRCTALFNTISINPFSEMLACCGLTCEYIPFFRLGNVKNHAVNKMYEQQFQDFLKIWLFIDGPTAILKFVDEKLKREKRNYSGHTCFLCAEIFKHAENIEIIRKNYQAIMPSIMLKYSLLKSTI